MVRGLADPRGRARRSRSRSAWTGCDRCAPITVADDRTTSDEWAAIELIGRRHAEGPARARRLRRHRRSPPGAPFRDRVPVDGVELTWLLESDQRALALVAQRVGRLVWHAIEERAGRSASAASVTRRPPAATACSSAPASEPRAAATRPRHGARDDSARRPRRDGAAGRSPRPARPARILGELRALEREIVELGYVRRSDALERVREAHPAPGRARIADRASSTAPRTSSARARSSTG